MTDFRPTLSDSFNHRPPPRHWHVALIVAIALLAGGVILLTALTLILTPTLPPLDTLGEDRLKVPMRVYTADGVLIGEFGEERRIPVKTADVPALLIEAILATEDDSFYRHHGVDFMGIARAAWINFRSGTHSQGASTITMQVARNFFLSPEKTYTRKLKEILLSFKLEHELGKEQILELYVNKIFLGHRAYGFGAAARIYYGKNLAELTLPEMAMLAGLPKAPSSNNPVSNPKTALERRNYALGRMHKLGYIDEAVYREAIDAPLVARKHALEYDVEAPYIAEMVRQHMIETYDEQTYAGGFHVYTTIQSRYQQAANAALRAGLLEYDQRHGYRGSAGHVKIKADIDKADLDEILKDYRSVGNLLPGIVLLVEEQSATVYTQDGYVAQLGWEGLSWARKYINENTVGRPPKRTAEILKLGDIVYMQGMAEGEWRLAQVPEAAAAIISLRPGDGAILALSGGFDFFESKFNRVTQAERQAGSNVKPFIYSAALEKGFTAASTVSGAPIAIEDEALEGVWRPENYSGRFYGPTRLRKALVLSLNLVSVRLLRAIGAGYAAEYLGRFGFDSEALPRNLSLALGSASVTPLTMASAFTVFANGGFRIEPYFITRIEDGNHNILEQANPMLVCQDCPGSDVVVDPKANETDAGAAAPEGPAGAAAVAVTEETTPAPGAPRFAPRVITPENAFVIRSIMQDIIKEGTGRRALVLKREDLAGKTGTTNDYRDAWFSGFNSAIVTTAWVGFDQPASLGRGEAGARAALPIWIDYMRVALEGTEETPLVQPEGVVKRFINSETGEVVAEPPAESTDEQDGGVAQEPPAVAETSDDDLAQQPGDEQLAEKPEVLEEYFILAHEKTLAGSGTPVEGTAGPDAPAAGSTPGAQTSPENIPQDLF